MSIEEIELQSFDFIDQHIDATFYEVPEDLLKIWHINMPLKNYLSKDFRQAYEFKIFYYALQKYRATYHINIPEEHVLSIFKVFQLMLSIPIIRTPRFPRETAFRIFDFNFYLDMI